MSIETTSTSRRNPILDAWAQEVRPVLESLARHDAEYKARAVAEMGRRAERERLWKLAAERLDSLSMAQFEQLGRIIALGKNPMLASSPGEIGRNGTIEQQLAALLDGVPPAAAPAAA